MAYLRTILLDPTSRHPPIESHLGPRMQHFIDRNTCIRHIQNEMAICRRIDLFLSCVDSIIIGYDLPLFSNIYFHLYCPTADTVRSYEVSFPCRAYVQVFEEDYLWIEMSYSILGHDNIHLRTSNYSNESRVAWESTHRITLDEVNAAKLGVQPT